MFATPGGYRGYMGFAAPEPVSAPAAERPAAERLAADRPTLCVHPFTLAFSRFHIGYGNGVALAIPKIRHVSESSLPPGIKHRSRLHWYLAEREARMIDKTAAALLLDEHGCVTETQTGNFFMIRDGHLFTPRAESTLTGVSQEFVLELARAAGWSVQRADLTREFVRGAQEAFLSSTTYCLMPVTRLDNAPIGDGLPGPMFRDLFERWSSGVGIDLRAQAERMSQPAQAPKP
jgi:branched-subunit amino acid aminotransferase/4-amino-4-deoxychorismate lyase